MYGRGRGSYLGLLLESQIGKSATSGSSIKGKTSENVLNEENSLSSQRQSAPSAITISSHSQGKYRLLSLYVKVKYLNVCVLATIANKI